MFANIAMLNILAQVCQILPAIQYKKKLLLSCTVETHLKWKPMWIKLLSLQQKIDKNIAVMLCVANILSQLLWEYLFDNIALSLSHKILIIIQQCHEFSE